MSWPSQEGVWPRLLLVEEAPLGRLPDVIHRLLAQGSALGSTPQAIVAMNTETEHLRLDMIVGQSTIELALGPHLVIHLLIVLRKVIERGNARQITSRNTLAMHFAGHRHHLDASPGTNDGAA